MRFAEKELSDYGVNAKADVEGRLQHRSPGGGFRESVFKERWFKLKGNLLFYFRLNDGVIDKNETAGVFVLESVRVQAEKNSSIPFAFSLVFLDEPDKKHIFTTFSDSLVTKWVSAISSCSYEYWREQLGEMQTRIRNQTGKDPLLMFPHYESRASSQQLSTPWPATSKSPVLPKRPSRSPNRKASTFKSHLLPEHDRMWAPSTAHKTNSAPGNSFQSFVPPRADSSSPKSIPRPRPQTFEPMENLMMPLPVRPSRSANKKGGISDRSNDAAPIRVAPPPPTTKPDTNLIEF